MNDDQNRYRCKRCRRIVSESLVPAHAENAHFENPAEIDFEPVSDTEE